MSTPELKFTALDLKRVEPDGTFSGYASLFGVEDMGRDIVLAGAFRDSLAKRTARSDTRRTAGAATSARDEPIRFGSAVLLSTPWDMIKLAVALTAIVVVGANAFGIWETAAQEERRLERAAAAEERRQEKAERDKRQKAWDDHWKKFDDDMRRVHGDFKR